MVQKHFDEEMKAMFQNIGSRMEPPSNLYQSIEGRIKNEEEKTMKNFLRTKKMKSFVIAAAICVVSISCYAASQAKSLISSSSEKFDTPPSVAEMNKAVGFAPKYITDDLGSGYTFESASIGTTEAMDENNVAIGSFKEMSFFYKNAEKPDAFIALGTHEVTELIQSDELGEELLLDSDIKGNYSQSEYRLYPPDVEPTEEDLKLEAEGKLFISYGSEKVETSFFQNIGWQQDGISYQFTICNADLTTDEIIAMANTVIAK